MSTNLQQLISEAMTLPPSEIKELRDSLDRVLSRTPALTEDEFEQYLFEQGVIGPVPPPITDYKPYQERKLAEILHGPPLSQTIIEERR